MANIEVFRAMIAIVSIIGIAQGQSHRVLTEPTVTLRKGTSGTISCVYERDAFGVHWKKGDTAESADDLIILDTFYTRGERSGPGYESGRFNITDDYSLLIYDVNIQDGGKYFCEIFDIERQDPVNNSTYIDIIAFPQNPFPAFEECEEEENKARDEICILHTVSAVNVTCYVQGIFPNLTLSFERERRIHIVANSESLNKDGTKNKFVTASLEASEEPYVCVASQIPGVSGNKTTEVLIKRLHEESPVTAIVVSLTVVLIVVVLIFVVIVFIIRKQQRRTRAGVRDAEESQELIDQRNKENVSFLELWMLLNRRTEHLKKLVQKYKEADSDAPPTCTGDETYDFLCHWKDKDRSLSSSAQLVDVLHAEKLLQFTRDHRKDTTNKVSQYTAEHVLWQIPETAKINQLLQRLNVNADFDNEMERKHVVNAALEKLNEWATGSFNENPVVLMSLALEEMGLSPIDRTFFIVHSKLLSPISKSEIGSFSMNLTGRHCRRLAEALQIYKLEDITAAIKENEKFLFNTPQMISQWIDQQQCSNYEKRRRLEDAVRNAERWELLGTFMADGAKLNSQSPCGGHHPDTLEDNEHETHHHPPDPRGRRNSEMEFAAPKDGKDSAKEIEPDGLIQAESDNHSPESHISQNFEEKSKDLEDAEISTTGVKSADTVEMETEDQLSSEEEEVEERIERSKSVTGQLLDNHTIYEIEAPKIAFNLLMDDILPFLTALGTESGKLYLPAYKQVPDPEKGTLRFVFLLLDGSKQNETRHNIAQSLMKRGFTDIARMITVNYEQSLSELIGITSSLGDEHMISLGLELGLPETDLDQCRLESGEIDKVEVMKLWKNQIYPPPYHYRTKLMEALQNIAQRRKDTPQGVRDAEESQELIDQRNKARFQVKTIHPLVTSNIFWSMDEDERKELGHMLGLKSKDGQQNNGGSFTCEQIQNKMNKLKPSVVRNLLRTSLKLRKGQKPLQGGLYVFAQEFMTLHS